MRGSDHVSMEDMSSIVVWDWVIDSICLPPILDASTGFLNRPKDGVDSSGLSQSVMGGMDQAWKEDWSLVVILTSSAVGVTSFVSRYSDCLAEFSNHKGSPLSASSCYTQKMS